MTFNFTAAILGNGTNETTLCKQLQMYETDSSKNKNEKIQTHQLHVKNVTRI
jgi:hypothetical protein